ncbi:MAG: hypothetical protein AAF485_09170 [Chloroflexota bacterium]
MVDEQMLNKLTIIETETVLIVAFADNPDDWLARFEKGAGFPAQQWAERMVSLYNQPERRNRAQPQKGKFHEPNNTPDG